MTWIVIVAVGLGSFAFRVGPLVLFQRISLSDCGDRVIRDAGTAALTALIVVSTKQSATGDATGPTVLAVAGAILLAARGATMLRLLVCGAAIYASTIVLMGMLVG